jgi:acetolactate synthase I/II/III large subunit
MRVADYIADGIARLGVRDVFMITGGGAMHLDDAIGQRDDLRPVFDHHEQACAIAAEGYARASGGISAVCVTTGPGGTNTVTGVLGQWHDSIPTLYVSGQVRLDTTVASTGLPLRQLGDQEADIVRLVAPITKYAMSIVDPLTVRYHFEKATWLATHGRPGPVWLDIPLNVQAAQIEPEALAGFDPRELETLHYPDQAGASDREASTLRPTLADRRGRPDLPLWPPVEQAAQAPGAFSGAFDRELAAALARDVLGRLRNAERPVILAGSALRTSGGYETFLRLVDRLGVPVCTAWNAADLLWDDHPLFAGRPGSLGQRSGNFALQNADVALVLGCRLNIRQVGYEFAAFAHDAYRIVVDIDEAELAKPTIFPDMAVHADVAFFVEELARLGDVEEIGSHEGWMSWCRERRSRYPAVLPAYAERETPVNPYVFVDRLSDRLKERDLVVCANGSACVIAIQAFKFKRRQRMLVNSGTAGMGYDLPAAVGAAFARRSSAEANSPGVADGPEARVVCLVGDGSILMNIQELQTIVQHQLPVKIFVFDNEGYASIRQTQDNLFAGRRLGEGPGSGLTFPDLVRVAEAFGIRASRVARHDELDEAIEAALTGPGPVLLNVVMDPAMTFVPKVIAERLPDGRLVSKPLEDMFPFLSRDEFAENMVVPPYAPPGRR